jgi:hypothetical protein
LAGLGAVAGATPSMCWVMPGQVRLMEVRSQRLEYNGPENKDILWTDFTIFASQDHY